jgi:hypothetical protein
VRYHGTILVSCFFAFTDEELHLKCLEKTAFFFFSVVLVGCRKGGKTKIKSVPKEGGKRGGHGCSFAGNNSVNRWLHEPIAQDRKKQKRAKYEGKRTKATPTCET